jgi:hypothetical protein
MISALILTLIVFILFWLIYAYVIMPAPFDPKIKWAFGAIATIIAVIIIAGIWGILPSGDIGWHDHQLVR